MLQFMNHCIEQAKFSNIQVIGMCENGEQALQVAQEIKPDILITDIDMPKINGLDLIKKIIEINPDIQTLIISAYDDFSYAQQAVRLLVSDYLLKESIEPETLINAIERLEEKVKEKIHQVEELNQWKTIVQKNEFTLKKQWLMDMIYRPADEDKIKVDQANSFGLEFDKKSYIPVIGKVMNTQKTGNSSDSIVYVLSNKLEKNLSERVECFVYDDNEFFILFPISKPVRYNDRRKTENSLSRLQEECWQYEKIKIAFVYESPVHHMNALQMVIKKLSELKEEWFYMDELAILKYSSILTKSWTPYYEDQEYSNYFDKLKVAIDLEDEEKAKKLIENWFDPMIQNRYHPDILKGKIYKLLIDLEYSYNSVSSKVENVYQEIMELQTITQLKDYLIKFLTILIQSVDTRKKTEKWYIIDAMKYVDRNLHKKITLEEVSHYLYLTSSYFSRIFKMETGTSFIQYVNQSKMDKAARYLSQTSKNIEEIALKLGYDNPSYFIKSFKKIYHTTPLKYRNNS